MRQRYIFTYLVLAGDGFLNTFVIIILSFYTFDCKDTTIFRHYY